MPINTDLSDFNYRFLSDFGHVEFLVAGRFLDAVEIDGALVEWDRLACEWYAEHGFKEIPDDKYIVGNRVRYKSVDALIEKNPSQLSDLGQVIYDRWLGVKKHVDRTRNKEPVVVIEPPPPVPTPPAPPAPVKPPKPSAPSRPSPIIVKIGVYMGLITTAIGVAAFFTPALRPVKLLILPIINMVIKALELAGV